MTIEQMRKYKRNHGYTYEQVAKLSGLPVGTVQKVFLGITKEPRYETMQALEKVFHEDMVREEIRYNQEREKWLTIDDYLAWPDEERIELIDGVIYDMGSPTSKHQLIVGEIFARFRDHIRKKKGECVAFGAAVDVQVDCSDHTVVQPDVMIVCDRNKIQNGKIFGAPDLIVEVLSPSTRRRDFGIKYAKYAESDVKEYWIVDLKNEKVIVDRLQEDEAMVMIYSFDEKVPVSIWNGECEIDFSEIRDYIAFLSE